MLKSYLKIAVRNMSRSKTYSFINISGLAIGMASFMLIMLYIQYELSFDGYHEKLNRIYNVYKEDPGNSYQGSDKYGVTPGPLAPTLMQEYPEVSAAARVRTSSSALLSYENKKFVEDNLYWMDPEAFTIFTFPFVIGDPSTALNDPFSILLSQSTAKKYFGDEDPLDKIIVYTTSNGVHNFKVTGVFKDIPENSVFRMDLVIPFETYGVITSSDLTRWGNNSYHTFFLMVDDRNPKTLEAKFPAFIDKYAGDNIWMHEGQKTKFRITPFKDLHFRTRVNFEMGVHNDMRFIYLFSALAILILVIACINYMNLSTAKSVQRSKEVGIRKVVGAYKIQLVKQFLSESLIFTFTGLLLSNVLVYLFLPPFNALIERQLELHFTNNLAFILSVFAIFILVGLSAGSYPAFHISSIKPVLVLKGSFGRTAKGSALRSMLVVAQFSVSVILIVCTLVVYGQLDFIKNADVGYSRDQIVIVRVRDRDMREKMQTVKEQLKKNSNILEAATSSSLPNRIGSQTNAKWPGRPEGMRIPIYQARVDYEFIDLYEIDIVKGRNFSREIASDASGAFLLNEAAVKAIGWNEPIGKDFTYSRDQTHKVVGVMKDFNMQSLHLQVSPLYFYLEPNGRGNSYLSVKIRGGTIDETIALLENAMAEFSTKYPFEYEFFDDIFNRVYKNEEQMGSVFSSFAFLAIFLACLGLFGLASFTAQQRTKEIGVRKVLGASNQNIVTLLSKEFTRWVVVANVIAWPVAYYVMNKWLQNFAYKIELGVSIFLYAGFIAFLIAFLTVGYQTIKAAFANPVSSLRHD